MPEGAVVVVSHTLLLAFVQLPVSLGGGGGLCVYTPRAILRSSTARGGADCEIVVFRGMM